MFRLRVFLLPTYNHPSMLSPPRIGELLAPFNLDLTPGQVDRVFCYLDLLVRWNRRINLTGIRGPEQCVTRHFGQSLYLRNWERLEGRLLDIGSGAGFPGLALKIVFPLLSVTLLEPITKKRAFLKEAARACGMDLVEVRGERLEECVARFPSPRFDAATARAVGNLELLTRLAGRLLKPGGRLFLWLTHSQAERLGACKSQFSWGAPIPIPLTREGEIWRGTWHG